MEEEVEVQVAAVVVVEGEQIFEQQQEILLQEWSSQVAEAVYMVRALQMEVMEGILPENRALLVVMLEQVGDPKHLVDLNLSMVDLMALLDLVVRWSGGGGGSSYCDGSICTAALYSTASAFGDGSVTISYLQNSPTVTPTAPTAAPTDNPTFTSTIIPTFLPSCLPTELPTITPSTLPTMTPSTLPSIKPTILPSLTPTILPTIIPTIIPTNLPTAQPTMIPTIIPSRIPTENPTFSPTVTPTAIPTITLTL
eukprot:gene43653-58145_t